MLRKVFWSVFSFLMVILLLLASCGPRAAPTSTPVPVTPAPIPTAPTLAPALTPAPKTATGKEEPKYGGIINVVVVALSSGWAAGPEVFAPLLPGLSSWGEGWILEQILRADYARSKAGTGEIDLGPTQNNAAVPSWEFVTGWLAESFKIPENGVWVLDIRKGVHWALDPASEASRLVGGREMTADDIKSSLEMMRDTPNSRSITAQPRLLKNMTVEKTGPWQLTVKTPVDAGVAYCWLMGGGGVQYIWPKEWLEKYGKINEWRNVVGTGPYMLTDFLSGSLATLKRNPNYWQKDPVGPGKGNQLPYPDGAKLFIIPDLSTRLATIRTGKGDMIENIQWEDAQSLIRSRPSLQSYGYVPFGSLIAMRTDKPDLPYKDIRVRQALTMATDFEAIKRDLYGGQGELLTYLVSQNFKQIYQPMEKLPASVQALYKYNPEKAKQFLAEAGYPNGFKAKIIVQNTTADLDLAAVVKALWAKVGIDLELQPKEGAVWISTRGARSHEELFMTSSNPVIMISQIGSLSIYSSSGDLSYANTPPGKDPVIENAFQTIQANFMVNFPKVEQATRELVPYALEQAYYIELPSPYSYRLWQPWIKEYYGDGALYVSDVWQPHPWVDQDLKEQMTGRR